MMQQILVYLSVAVIAAIVLVLGFGLFNMFRGGNPNLSQKLMRARVLLQALAILLLIAIAFLFSPR